MQETSVQKISDGTLPSQMLLAISVSRPNDSMQRQIFYFLTRFFAPAPRRSGNLSAAALAGAKIFSATPQPRPFSNLGEVNLCVDRNFSL
jgi:hypothetical protein